MSDTGGDRGAPPAPGWWRADDGNWYPPAGGSPTESLPPTQSWTPPPPPAGLVGPTAAYGPPPGPSPAYGYGYGPAVAPVTNGLAIAALVCGILWLYWVGSILALAFGYVAKSQIDRSGGAQSGRGLAIAGIVLGWVGVAAFILFMLFFVALLNDIERREDIFTDGALGALVGR